jgi:hypothetical protein
LKKKKKRDDITVEESAYRARFDTWLQDHGEPITDEKADKSEEESADSSSETE